MGKLVYSIITKDDLVEYSKFIKKLKHDMHIMGHVDSYAYLFAVDEETNRIVSYSDFEEKDKLGVGNHLKNKTNPEYKDDLDLFINMTKMAINYVSVSDKALYVRCRWNEYEKLEELGFKMDEEYYKYVTESRNELLSELEEAKNGSYPEDEKKYIIEQINIELNYPKCLVTIKSKDVKSQLQVDGYKDFKELPDELISQIDQSVADSHIFKEDDKYLYEEMKKIDPEYNDVIFKIADEITGPNLRVNGGTLSSFLGLEYPELLVYLKDKDNSKIVGYVGLTKNYGPGLYISQIAVRDEYKHKGIGTILVKDAIRRAHEENIDVVSAEINPNNKYSLALFAKNGFIKNERYYLVNVPEYVLNNEDILDNTKDSKKV